MAVLSIPTTWTTAEVLTSASLNANFVAVANAVNSIDNTNIGTAGIYASQIIPTSTAQATFGGSIDYVFTNPLIVRNGGVPPSFVSSGVSNTDKLVHGTLTNASIASGLIEVPFVITLSSNATFTNANTYVVIATADVTAGNVPAGWNAYYSVCSVIRQSGTQFTVNAYNGGVATTGGGSATINWFAIGF